MKSRIFGAIMFLSLHIIPCHSPANILEKSVEPTRQISVAELYDSAIEHLKEREGYRAFVYRCPSNQPTIGYGHGNPDPTLTFISKEDAVKLLKEDLDGCIRYIENDTGMSLQTEPGRVLALSLFTFNVGRGNWYRSTLRKLVLNEQPIDTEIVKWCHIKKKKSSHLLERRLFELNLYTVLL